MFFILFSALMFLLIQSILGFSMYRLMNNGEPVFDYYQIFVVSLGLGYFVSIVITYALSLLSIFNLFWTLIVSCVFVAYCNYDLLTDNDRLRSNVRDLLEQIRSMEKVKGLIFLVSLCLIFGPVLYGISSINYSAVSTLGYMSKFKRIVDNQGLDYTTSIYGIESNQRINKIGMNLFSAYFYQLFTIDLLILQKIFVIQFILWLCFNVFSYFSDLFIFELSIIGLASVVMNNYLNGLFVAKFDSYRGESLGMVLLFLNLFLYLKWKRSDEPIVGNIAVIMASMQAITHLATFIPFCLFTGCHFLYEVYMKRSQDVFRSFVVHYLKILLVFLLLMAPLGTYPEYLEGMDSSEYEDVDLTYEFKRIISGGASRELTEETIFTPPIELFKNLIRSTSRSNGFRYKSNELLPVLVVSIAIGILVTKKKNYEILYPSVLYVFVLFVFGLIFNLFFDSWVYATFPERRVFPYVFLTYVNLGTLIFDSKYQLNISVLNKGLISVNKVVVLCILMASTAVALPSFNERVDVSNRSVISDDAYDSYLWLKKNTDESANVLLNVRTVGSFKIIAERRGLFEGGATYFEPDLTLHLARLVNETNEFYYDPNLEFLSKYEVSHIMVPTARARFGGSVIGSLNLNVTKIYSQSFLNEVSRIGNVVIYEVNYEDN